MLEDSDFDVTRSQPRGIVSLCAERIRDATIAHLSRELGYIYSRRGMID